MAKKNYKADAPAATKTGPQKSRSMGRKAKAKMLGKLVLSGAPLPKNTPSWYYTGMKKG